jgi:hypothetical protein
MTIQLHLHIQPNEPSAALQSELLAELLEEFFSSALRDAVYDLPPYRKGVDDCQFEVTADNDTLTVLVLAVQAAWHSGQQGKSNA